MAVRRPLVESESPSTRWQEEAHPGLVDTKDVDTTNSPHRGDMAQLEEKSN